MKRTILAVALITMAGVANAALWCKNEAGETYKWSIGTPRPANSANFKMFPSQPVFDTTGNVVCFLNAQLYRDVAANTIGIRGVPVQAAIPPNLVSETELGEQSAGTVYRGDMARWLIDNLPSSYGEYATRAYYNTIVP